MYTMIGTVVSVGDVQTFASGFTKRDLIVEKQREKPSKYPCPVKFSFKKDDCSLLDGVKKGDTVTVGFDVDGRSWEGPKGLQYFVDLNAFKLDVAGASGASKVPPPAVPEEEDMPDGADDLDTMPF